MEIILSNGTVALVSAEDYDYLQQWPWTVSSNGRAHRIYNGVTTLMHHAVALRMGLALDLEIDHADRNHLNNQRTNLRRATKSQNCANSSLRRSSTSGYKGVTFNRRKNKWAAQIQVRKTMIGLGYYDVLEEAARAYDNAARRFFGEFANTNFKEAEHGS